VTAVTAPPGRPCTLCAVRVLVASLWLALGAAAAAHAQRRVRIGAVGSVVSLEDLSGKAHTFGGFGAAVALLASDDGETGLTVSRYPDLSTDGRTRRLTLFGLDSYYYPIGARGIAPFASATLGLARVTESAGLCPLLCGDTLAATSEFALGFGLGLRTTLAQVAVTTLEGRFLQVPGSAIQTLEVRVGAAAALGTVRRGEFAAGTVGPAVGALVLLSGPLRARGPLVGARFRRDTDKGGTVGLELAWVPLAVAGSCAPPGCRPDAVWFAPGYEAAMRPAWGRLYAEAGLLLVGVYTQGPDRGVAEGAHGGVGVDLAVGRALWNANSRLVWLRRTTGEDVFAMELGFGLAPALRSRSAAH